MKIIILLYMLVLTSAAVAQTGVAPRPDCDFGFIYNVVGGVITSTSPSSPNRLPPSQAGGGIFGWDNRIPICTSWTLYYQTEGVSTVSIELDQAPSTAGIPGTWTAWTNLSPGTSYPLTALNVGQGSSFAYQPWVSVNLNSAGGTGTVYGRVFGWKAGPGQSGSGVTTEAGTAPVGSTPVGNPVAVGFRDSNGNIQYLAGSPSGSGLGLFIGGVLTPADGLSNTNFGMTPNANAQATLIGPYVFNGSTWDRQFYCPNTTTIPSTANTTSAILVAASGSTKIRICSFIVSPNATAGSFDIIYGTTANCASGTTTLTGTINVLGTTAAPVLFAGGPAGALTTPASQAVCVRATTSTVTGSFTWAQF